MIPYVGSKVYQKRYEGSTAFGILQVLPEAEHFYDLFGGGGSVTEAALLFKNNGIIDPWAKWRLLKEAIWLVAIAIAITIIFIFRRRI